MMARGSDAPSMGRIQKRKTNLSKSSLSACNARPVHTDGPIATVCTSDPDKVEAIKAGLTAKWGLRRIARELSVGVCTVYRIRAATAQSRAA